MLVLTRKLNESIVIDGNIHIQVIGVQGDRVRIGITAPGEVPIVRAEILARMEAEESYQGNAALAHI